MDDHIADFHIHSKYSHDSLLSIKSILKKAKIAGLTRIAITDHGTIRGGVEAKKQAGKYDIDVIVGAEIKTDCGDITGLFLDHEIHETSWTAVIAEIRQQNGVVILPHPYRDHVNTEQIAQEVDFIEIWNARSFPEENALAADLAQRLGKPAIIGSDAHFASEIGSVKVRVGKHTLQSQEIFSSRYSSVSAIHRSRFISLLKQRKWGMLFSLGAAYLGKKIQKSRKYV